MLRRQMACDERKHMSLCVGRRVAKPRELGAGELDVGEGCRWIFMEVQVSLRLAIERTRSSLDKRRVPANLGQQRLQRGKCRRASVFHDLGTPSGVGFLNPAPRTQD